MEGIIYFDFDNKVYFVNENKEIVEVLDNVYGFPTKIEDNQIICNSLNYKGATLNDNPKLLWLNSDLKIKRELELPYSQHHDYVLKENSVIYLSHHIIEYKGIKLLDEKIVEVDCAGNVLFEWNMIDHLDYFNLTNEDWDWIKNDCESIDGHANYLHCNSITELGDNVLALQDDRFKADNLLVSSRQLSTVFIIDKHTKEIVWDLGRNNKRDVMQQTFGQHNPYMLPNGNIILFDNGSDVGYNIKGRHFSRVLEINPLILEVIWFYENPSEFYSRVVSNALRLDNGNTLILDGCHRHIFEVDAGKNIVWDFYLSKEVSKNYSKFIYRVSYMQKDKFENFLASKAN